MEEAPTVCGTPCRFRVRFTEDGLAALVDCSVPPEGVDVLIPGLLDALERRGITDQISLMAAEQRLRAAAEASSELSEVPVLEGRAPVPPQDEAIAWERDFFNEEFVVDPETGVIDYRERAGQCSVAEGDCLAHIIPGKPGTDGLDIFGQPLPAAPPNPVFLRAGRNVRFDAAEKAFYAVRSGRVRLCDEELSVDEVFVVQASVGLETGNIHHPGTLVVEQNIEAGSQVEVSGDVEVHGYIEDAVITCGGNLTVRGGITGGAGSVIRAGGSVQAKFVLNATIEAAGNVLIEREIDNAVVRARGAVRVPRGRIVAGEVVALGGIDTAHAGSDAGIPTVLVAGEDFALAPRIKEKKAEIEALKSTMEKVRVKLEPLAGQEHRLSPASREVLKTLRRKLAQAQERIAALDAQVLEIYDESRKRAVNRILVRACIHTDAFFRVAQRGLYCRETVAGPVSILIRDDEIGIFTAATAH